MAVEKNKKRKNNKIYPGIFRIICYEANIKSPKSKHEGSSYLSKTQQNICKI